MLFISFALFAGLSAEGDFLPVAETAIETVDPADLPGKPCDPDSVVVTAGGTQVYTIYPGRNNEAGPEAGDTVTVHYAGYTLDGHEFDSSYRRNQPATFPLRAVIRGWQEGCLHMHPQGIYKLVIPAESAYGNDSRPGGPPTGVLVFDVELLDIHKG